MAKVFVPTVVLIIAALIVLPQVFFSVDETQLAIVTQFGEFKRAETEPGLSVKWPFVQSVTRFDKRLLRVDATPASLLTADKRNLIIDAYARYRITDPLLFFREFRDEALADSRVSAIVNSQLRSEVALDLQSDIISETREAVMDRITVASNRLEVSRDEALTEFPDGLRAQEVTILLSPAVQDPEQPVRPRDPTEAELAALEREQDPPELEGLVAHYFIPIVGRWGIEIVDVRIKRADFPADVAQSVYDRMSAEREQIASGLRAEGDQRDLEIRAETDRQVQITLQTAEGRAALLRGEGEGEAIKILAAALEQDPEFYDFQRTLQAYRTSLDGPNTTLVLDPDSDFFKFLQDPFGNVTEGPATPAPATPTPPPTP